MNSFRHEGLRGGVWRGVIDGAAEPGPLAVVHRGERVAVAEVQRLADGSGWAVTAPLPLDRLTDGATSFLLVADDGGADAPAPGARRLGVLPVVSGAPLDADLRAEMELMRAEIDLLKREFRRQAGADRAQAEAAITAGAEASRLAKEAHDKAWWAERAATEAKKAADGAAGSAKEAQDKAWWAEQTAGEAKKAAEGAAGKAKDAHDKAWWAEKSANEARDAVGEVRALAAEARDRASG